ncbi:hypothetical protein QOZ80_9AG0683320 [Eleusine coracana subsp. coracana]|nr:hypothetical protein QOZ80_9AG0683320 [Eleusine coracana subsp. coracana]
MGCKSKSCSRKPRASPTASAPPPLRTNADWENSTAAFQKEAESAIRAWPDDDGAAASRLAARHARSPLALHVLGHALASLGRAADAIPPLRLAADLAPRCPGIAATLLYACRPREAVDECDRALAVAYPTDPALHAATCRHVGVGPTVVGSSPQARVAVAQERLLGVHADAEALAAPATLLAAAPPVQPPTKAPCFCHHVTRDGSLTVRVADLAADCGDGGLAAAVEFAKATGAWAYWLCPVCDEVFLDATSFTSHVEGDHIGDVQKLMPKRAFLDANDLYYTIRWATPLEDGEERRRDLDKVRDILSGICSWNSLPAGVMDRLIRFARSRSEEPLPYCIPSCVISLDQRELKRLVGWLDQVRARLHRDWGFVRAMSDEGKKSKSGSVALSLVQDGSVLSLEAENVPSTSGEDGCSCDATCLCEDPVTSSWHSLQHKCVHRGNEVLNRIYELSDAILRLSSRRKEKVHNGCFLTEDDSINIEMLLLNNEVDHLKKKLVVACTFDYHAVILPLIRTNIWDILNNSSPGEDLDD